MKSESKRILIVNLSSSGDVVLSTPVIKVLREVYSNAYLAYLVGDKAQDIIVDNPYLDQTIVLDQSRFNRIRSQQGTISALKSLGPVINQLKSKEFDLVIDLHSVFKSSLISYLTSAEQRIGIKKGWNSLFYTDKTEQREDLHLVDEYLTLLESLGIESDTYQREFTITTSDKEREYITRLLSKYGVRKDKKLVAINPTSNKEENWPEERFAQVGDWINHNLEAQVLILGSSDDEHRAKRIVNGMKTKAINLTGKTNLKELAELLKDTELLISGNTGEMQLAMAVETSLLVLFGSTDPLYSGPYQGHNIVIKSPEDDITQIRVETIIQNLSRIL